jgi:RHS repeat-associated protein
MGNLLKIKDQKINQPQIFGYDLLNRLISASTTGGAAYGSYNETYTYAADTGNLSGKAGVSYTYEDPGHLHAVTHLDEVQRYWYDANGNLTRRDPPGSDYYDFVYDAENRITQAKKNDTVIASFVYDGDGKRVKATVNGVTTSFIGTYFEWTNGQMTKYYYAGGQRVAMRDGSGALYYLIGDHLGSTSVVATAGGSLVSRTLYSPWGTVRYQSSSLPTDYTFTGQYSHVSDFGLLFYVARWYDPALGRFAQADTIVPGAGNPMAFDRYAYVFNSPLNYLDPSGHYYCDSNYADPEDCKGHIKVPYPSQACSSDANCWDSYRTYSALVQQLGHVPTIEEILYMTAGAEYWSYVDFPYTPQKPGVTPRSVGREGLARNYYEACGTNGCYGSELYWFMTGYQPWFGLPGKVDGSPAARADHLIAQLNSDFAGTGDESWEDVRLITNREYASGKRWTEGAKGDRPWQWYGLFHPDPARVAREGSFGFDAGNTAILTVDLGGGAYFWMFTFIQDRKFSVPYWEAPYR